MKFGKNVVIIIMTALLTSFLSACSESSSVGIIGGADGGEAIVTGGGGDVGGVDRVDGSAGNGAEDTGTVGSGATDSIDAAPSEQSTPVTTKVTTDATGTTASASATTAPTTTVTDSTTAAAPTVTSSTVSDKTTAATTSTPVSSTTAPAVLSDAPDKVLSDVTGILTALGVPVPASAEPANITSLNSADILGLTEEDFSVYADSASYVIAAESDTVSHFMTVIKAKDNASAAKLKALLTGAGGFDKSSAGGTSPAKCAVIDRGQYLFLAASDVIAVDSAIVVFEGIAGSTDKGEIVEIE